jgi:hypothetical protein
MVPSGELLDKLETINLLVQDHGYTREAVESMPPFEFELTVMMVMKNLENKKKQNQ